MDTELFSLIRDGGLTGLMLFFIIGGFRGWWIFGPLHDRITTIYETRYSELVADRDYWRSIAIEALQTAHEGVGLAERRRKTPAEDA